MKSISDIAKSQIGVRETGGPNAGLPLARYGLRGDICAPWCARFVRWCAGEAGIHLPGKPYDLGSVQYMEDQFKVDNLILKHPEAPCVVFYKTREGSDIGPGRHCGIVVGVSPTFFLSVEGNYGDAVAFRSVSFKDPRISCYGRFPPPRGKS